MKFVNPSLLILIALTPIFGALWLFIRARADRRLSSISLTATHEGSAAGKRRAIQTVLILSGIALVLLATARPRWGKSAEHELVRSRNVVVALDVSRSMLAMDVHPNRLERAKADIADLIDELDGDRAALVAFRRTGVLLCPLTTDYAYLRSALEGACPESAARGETDLGAAIRTSLSALDPAADGYNAIILISDGGDLRGGALDAASSAAKRSIPIFTVGLGDTHGATIPQADGNGAQKYKGENVVTSLDSKTLESIAKASGGRYVPLATAGTAETTLGAIYRRFLRQVAAKEQFENEEIRATERYGFFLVPGLILLLAAACLSRGRYRGKIRRKITITAALAIACMVLNGQAAETPLSDREIFNLGYNAWKSGDVSNAVTILRPLELSRTHGDRAAEIIGKIRSDDRRTAGGNSAVALAAAEDAATAFQLSLRKKPNDARRMRNFTRAIDGISSLRESAHIEKVLKETKGKAIDQLLLNGVTEARSIITAARNVLTNEASEAISESEALAARANALADIFIPAKEAVVNATTNEQQAALISANIESVRVDTKNAADLLSDLNPSADKLLERTEGTIYRFCKMTAAPSNLIDLDIDSQKEKLNEAALWGGRDWQSESLELTRSFRERFPEWARNYEQQAASDTNKPPFTAEQQAEITQLAEDAELLQTGLVKNFTESDATNTLAKLVRIKELLPKDGKGGSQQNDKNNKDNQPQQNNDKTDKQKNNSDKNNSDQKQNDKRQDEQKKEAQQEQQSASESDNDRTSDDVEELIRRAKERSEEHDARKRERAKNIPSSPNERDW